MNRDLETFNYFVEDILSSDINLLKFELDILLMQNIFRSIDLDILNKIDTQEDIVIAL